VHCCTSLLLPLHMRNKRYTRSSKLTVSDRVSYVCTVSCYYSCRSMPVMHLDQRSVMTTMNEVTMKRSHFRLKVDLSKFFYDARRFCWVFVDGTKIQQVIHMKQHISRLFNIEEPFHLLLNNSEYLTPIEDVRILKENETILLVHYTLLIFFITM